MWVKNRITKTNGVSYIIQKGGKAVFSPEGQKQIHDNIKIYKNNAKILTDALDKIGLWYCGGKNAPYIWLKCPDNMSSWDFFDYLLNEIQVVGTPGEGFGKCGERDISDFPLSEARRIRLKLQNVWLNCSKKWQNYEKL